MPQRPPWLHLPWLRAPRRLARRLALVNALQLLLVGGSLSWFSYSLGRQSGLELSEHYRQIAAIRELSQRLSQRLSAPRTINALNLLEIRSDHHALSDYDHFARIFWRQMQVFPVSYINYGGASGDFIGVERTDSGELLLNEDTPRRGRGRMVVSRLGPRGERGRQLEIIPGLTTFHAEAWYADTVRAGRPTWSAIYSWEDKPEIFSISYNAPLYGPDRRLVGVIGVDMVLSQLSTWLSQIWRDREGLALIVEPDGRLVASSRPADTLSKAGGRLHRADLASLRNPLAQTLLARKFQPRDSSGPLTLRPGVLKAIPSQPVLVAGRPYFIDASRWGQEEGLDWLLLTALPAEAKTRASAGSTWIALLGSALALGLAALLADQLIRWLLRPLRQLQGAAGQLSDSLGSNGAQPLHFSSGIQAGDSSEMQAVDGAISQLVGRFNRLTAQQRRSAERERQRDAQALALLKEKLRSSLEAAAVAHEINQPLSVLLLNSQLLLEQLGSQHDTALPASWRHQLQTISTEAERVVLTIEKMRTLLRNVQTEPQRLDLREVARSAVLYLRSSGLADGCDLEDHGLEASAEPAWIKGDAVQIQIAIVNLLRNAAEALADTSSREVWIGIDLQRDAEGWQLSVADSGPGFAADTDPGTLLQTTKAGGSGLGLFVVCTTMDNHHGRMELGRSQRGGALVRLHLPAAPSIPAT